MPRNRGQLAGSHFFGVVLDEFGSPSNDYEILLVYSINLRHEINTLSMMLASTRSLVRRISTIGASSCSTGLGPGCRGGRRLTYSTAQCIGGRTRNHFRYNRSDSPLVRAAITAREFTTTPANDGAGESDKPTNAQIIPAVDGEKEETSPTTASSPSSEIDDDVTANSTEKDDENPAGSNSYADTSDGDDIKSVNELNKNLKPSEIVDALDRHIVGQPDAKKSVAIAMRNRWRRRQLPEDLRKEVTPRNVLLVGPTG